MTIEGIKELMIDQSPLKSMLFLYCKNVTLDDITNLRILANRKIWDISLGYKNRESDDPSAFYTIHYF